MSKAENTKTIKVSEQNHIWLESLGTKSESFDDIITCLRNQVRLSNPKKWWLISAKDVKLIRKALTESEQRNALHVLDSGLHLTKEIPADWKEEE